MKHCPHCQEALHAEAYEDIPVWRCPACRGALVAGYRFDLILGRRGRTAEELAEEARREFSADTRRQIRCPRCRGTMGKRAIRGCFGKLAMDVCPSCSYVWLDGGELAVAQIAFAGSPSGRDIFEREDRMKRLENDPAAKAAFERDLAALPDELPGGELLQSAEPGEDPVLDALMTRLLRHLLRLP